MIKFMDKDNNLVSIAKLLYASDQINKLDGMIQFVKILRIFNNDKETFRTDAKLSFANSHKQLNFGEDIKRC